MADILATVMGTPKRPERSSSEAARRRRIEIRRARGLTGQKTPVLSESESSTVVALPETPLPDYPKYGVISVCGARDEMEDTVAIHPFFLRQLTEHSSSGFHYFAVYDGHGCDHVSKKCKERLHVLVREEFEVDADWEKSMVRSFTRMDEEVFALTAEGAPKCKCDLQGPDSVGSTAVVSVLTTEKIVVANCGDSRAVLGRNGKAIPLSSDHKPDRKDEEARIHAASGRIFYWDGVARVQGSLAMSRAIGDSYLKPYVISTPEVTVMDRVEEDEFLILASDGLWDVVSNDIACTVAQVCLKGKRSRQLSSSPERNGAVVGNVVVGEGYIQDRACEEAAALLTKLALGRRSSDNISVVVVDLRRDT